MIQAFGLTSDSRKGLTPAVDDVSFEAHAGRVTALLGTAGAGKTTTLRLMLELQQGRGITYFKGRPLHRIPHPAHEVGALLGDVPGHPARTVRGHLRMLCAAAGLPARRADEVLEVVGLVSFREERLGTLSRGMDRRLGLACVLLADPHTWVLDDPARGLSPRESRWLHGMLRAHATQGGTVLFTTADPKEAARTADRVVTLECGTLVADQEATDFARHRLRPRVAVRSPHATRLAAVLTKEARTARHSVEVVREDGNRLSVYGSTCADIGETAFRHGILVHQLADEVGDMGAGAAVPNPAVEQAAGERPDQPAPEAGAGRSAAGDARFTGRREPTGAREAIDTDTHGRSTTGEAAGPGSTSSVAGAAPHGPAAEAADAPPALPAGEAAGVSAESARATGGLDALFAAAMENDQPLDASHEERAGLPEEQMVSAHAETLRLAGRPSEGPSRAGSDPAPATAHADRAPGAPDTACSTGAPPAASAHSDSAPVRAGSRFRPLRSDDLGSSIRARRSGPSAPAHPEDPPGAAYSDEKHTIARPAAALTSARSQDAPARSDTSARAGTSARTDAPNRFPFVAARLSARRRSGTRKGSAAAPQTDHHTARPATDRPTTRHATTAQPSIPTPRPAEAAALGTASPLPPPISVRLGRSPLRPLRYELRRACGISTGFVICATVLVVSALMALVMGQIGHTPQPRLLAAWPQELPLPPAALGAGLLGALAFGDEFRHPALAADRGTVPRRLGLLTAKLLVAAAATLLLAFLTIGCDAEVLYLVYGRELTQVPGDWLSPVASWIGLVVGCAWAGVLAAGLFRSATAGLAAVVAVPVVVVPLVEKALGGTPWDADGLPARLRRTFLLPWPFGGDRYLAAAARVIGQPVGGALTLSLLVLLGGFALTTLRNRTR
ncbi:ATP-binding cassette domain-containing protein [Streptomyces sp. NPDC047017]|uniref:ATP-binding cassette domain-containing protein n=1 Tax=Streptomyces sp. NPDC047017 TaxID=3155024 RepID=UPI003403B28B